MNRRFRRAATPPVLLLIAAAILSTGAVGFTGAYFSAETQSPSNYSAGWLDPPTGLTVAAGGYDAVLAWTHGTNGLTGQQVQLVDNGTSSSCSSPTFSTSIAMAAATTGSYTDANRVATSGNGDWFCYRVVSTRTPTNWTAASSNVALQLGLAATVLSIQSGGASGSVSSGDKITITFNQRTTLASILGSTSGTLKVCLFASGTSTAGKLYLGDTRGGSTCNTSDSVRVGILSVTSITGNDVYTGSSYSLSTSAPWTLQITLSTSGTHAASGTASFTPSSGIKSFQTTDQATICTSSASTCAPSASASF